MNVCFMTLIVSFSFSFGTAFYFLFLFLELLFTFYFLELLFQEYEETCLFTARIPARRFSSSISQHFKMFPPFASNEGYSASGLRYQSDGVRVTHPLPHIEFTRIRERTCDLTLALSYSPFAYYSYISLYSHLFLISTVILLLCDHRVRIFQQCFVDADRYIRNLDFRCLVLPTLKWPPSIRPRSPPK